MISLVVNTNAMFTEYQVAATLVYNTVYVKHDH